MFGVTWFGSYGLPGLATLFHEGRKIVSLIECILKFAHYIQASWKHGQFMGRRPNRFLIKYSSIDKFLTREWAIFRFGPRRMAVAWSLDYAGHSHGFMETCTKSLSWLQPAVLLSVMTIQEAPQRGLFTWFAQVQGAH